jgi:toxic protein SymE
MATKTLKNIRQIKLQPKSRISPRSCTGLKSVPWLNVSGVWLAHAGFKVGDVVSILVGENELIIKPAL